MFSSLDKRFVRFSHYYYCELYNILLLIRQQTENERNKTTNAKNRTNTKHSCKTHLIMLVRTGFHRQTEAI